MNWETLLGNAYVDGMTDEEAQAKFNELYMPRADHDREMQKNKSLIDGYTSQLADAKRKERERMSEEDRKKAEQKDIFDAMESKNKQLERTLKIRDLEWYYKSILYRNKEFNEYPNFCEWTNFLFFEIIIYVIASISKYLNLYHTIQPIYVHSSD